MSNKDKSKFKLFFKNAKMPGTERALRPEMEVELRPEHHAAQRCKTLRELGDSYIYNINLDEKDITRLYELTKDLIVPNKPAEHRHTALSFYKKLIHSQYKNLSLMREHFFLVIQNHEVPEDLRHRLELLDTLTENGKDITNFEEKIGRFMLSWIPAIAIADLLGPYLAMLVNIIKFNAAHLDNDTLVGIVQNACQLSCTVEDDAIGLQCLTILEIVIGYAIFPSDPLALCVVTLCRTVNHRPYCQVSWKHCKKNPNKNQARCYIEMLTTMDFQTTKYVIKYRRDEFTISDDFLLEKALNRDTKVGDSRIEEAYECKIPVFKMGIPHYHLVSFTNALLFKKDENERRKSLKVLYEKIESINSGMPKYCTNSREHRLLSRLLYIVLRFVQCTDLDSESLTQLWKFLMNHNNQPNIAIFYQIIIANKFGWHEIFSKVSTQLEANKCTPSQEMSMIAILYGSFQKNLKDMTSKKLGQLIDLLWPLAMGASLQTRLYAQLAIFNTVDGFRVKKSSLPETFIKLSQTIRKTITDEQIEKFQEEVRFMDEIDWETFDNVMYYTNAPYVEYSGRRFTINNSSQNEGVQCASIRTIEASCDVQRKLKPITDFMPQSNLYSYPEIKENVLYVVASLVDEIPNLGCMARTCEVLGVRNLVIDSKAIIAKDDFKNLSMTAEKNLNIIEVKPSMLADFLIIKKAEGFKIIGAEKTANSCSFVNFQYPKRSVLLLGHEKEGIPPNLLGFLDYAVEIPQFGMIRSLNVHVTGALFMWEYCKQRTHCEG